MNKTNEEAIGSQETETVDMNQVYEEGAKEVFSTIIDIHNKKDGEVDSVTLEQGHLKALWKLMTKHYMGAGVFVEERDLKTLEQMVYKGYYEEDIEINPLVTVRFRTITFSDIADEISKDIDKEVSGLSSINTEQYYNSLLDDGFTKDEARRHADVLKDYCNDNVSNRYYNAISTKEELVRALVGVKNKDSAFRKFSPDNNHEEAREYLTKGMPQPLYNAISMEYMQFTNKIDRICQGKYLKNS